MNFEKRLKEDAEIMKRIQYLESTVDHSRLTEKQAKEVNEELEKLRYRYYQENNDIRLYWKLY